MGFGHCSGFPRFSQFQAAEAEETRQNFTRRRVERENLAEGLECAVGSPAGRRCGPLRAPFSPDRSIGSGRLAPFGDNRTARRIIRIMRLMRITRLTRRRGGVLRPRRWSAALPGTVVNQEFEGPNGLLDLLTVGFQLYEDSPDVHRFGSAISYSIAVTAPDFCSISE
jgi:hypothetical protein